MAIFADNVYGLDDVGMLESATDAKLCGDLFLVLLLCFACALWTKLLDGKDHAAVLGRGFDESDGASCARA